MSYSEEIAVREEILKNIFNWKASIRIQLMDIYTIEELYTLRLTNTGYKYIDDRSVKKIVTVIRTPPELAEYYDSAKSFEFVDPDASIEIYCIIRNYVGLFAHQLVTAFNQNIDFLSPSSPDYDALSDMLDDIRKLTSFANYLGTRINKGYDKLDERLLRYVDYRDKTRRINRKQNNNEVDLKFLFEDFLPSNYRHLVSPWFRSE